MARRNPATARTLLLAGGAGVLAQMVYGFARVALGRPPSITLSAVVAAAAGSFVGWRVHGDADAMVAGGAAGAALPLLIAAPLYEFVLPERPLLGIGG